MITVLSVFEIHYVPYVKIQQIPNAVPEKSALELYRF